MILSASRRTDIPSFYSEWFINRLRDGYVLTKNPFNPAQVKRVMLSPKLIDCIVFWTKDPIAMFWAFDELNKLGYKYYFQFTLTPYDSGIEKNLRPKNEIIQTFINLSKKLSKERVFWRYDPVILNRNLSINYHLEKFNSMCKVLYEYTNSVTVSFIDLYKKIKTPLIREVSTEEVAIISSEFSKIAKNYNLPIRACCEQLSEYGIEKSSCIDKKTIEYLCGYSIDVKQDKNQRNGCGCVSSIDIGVYNTCKNGCVYCYANYSEMSTEKNFKRHEPGGEFLLI